MDRLPRFFDRDKIAFLYPGKQHAQHRGNALYTYQLNEIPRVLVQLTELLSNRSRELVYRLCEFFEIAGLVVLQTVLPRKISNVGSDLGEVMTMAEPPLSILKQMVQKRRVRSLGFNDPLTKLRY